MKIGLIFSAFNSEKYIDECLSPWMNLKDKLDITISCTSNMYRDYLNYGINPDNFGTLRKLINYKLDYLMTSNGNIYFDENESKNTSLNLLKDKCDIVWILDADEIYTEKQILDIVEFVKNNPHDWFSVNFKNYTLTDKLWMDGFCPPRIFRTNRYDGIKQFYFDNHIEYNNGDRFDNKLSTSIPRNIAWVTHYSWLSDDSRSQHKIVYQNQRFAGEDGVRCAFSLENDKLVFNQKFYYSRGLSTPVLHETIDNLSNNFTVSFNKDNNTFYIQNVLENGIFLFKIYNGNSGELIYQTNLTISSGYEYFIYPTDIRYHEMEGFDKFRVEVLSDNKIIHNEFLHTNF